MTANYHSYSPNRSIDNINRWLIYCLFLIIVAKPVVNFTLLITDTKYELTEKSINEKPKEKSDNLDEDDSEKFYNHFNLLSNFYPKLILSYFNIHNFGLNINRDILIPPPKF